MTTTAFTASKPAKFTAPSMTSGSSCKQWRASHEVCRSCHTARSGIDR
ncbi:50S ribosomal protein L32 [Duodenibacillus massiliensis]